jgi:hypothetical protein
MSEDAKATTAKLTKADVDRAWRRRHEPDSVTLLRD